ncbi:MAG: hypothetical protein IPP88_20115 [Betaproteobacteria bacterium]|nr:hypothetical protein [Betaproteobacteria bacterium]
MWCNQSGQSDGDLRPASPVTFGVTPITLTATASSGLTAFTFSTSSAASICTVATHQLTIVGVGTCVLTASRPAMPTSPAPRPTPMW